MNNEKSRETRCQSRLACIPLLLLCSVSTWAQSVDSIDTLVLEGDTLNGEPVPTLMAFKFGYATSNADGDFVVQGLAAEPDGSTISVLTQNGLVVADGDVFPEGTADRPYIENPVTARVNGAAKFTVVLPFGQGVGNALYIGDVNNVSPLELVVIGNSAVGSGAPHGLNDHYDVSYKSGVVRYDLDPSSPDNNVSEYTIPNGATVNDPDRGNGTISLSGSVRPIVMNDRSIIFPAAITFGADSDYRGLLRCIHSDPFGTPPTFDCATYEILALGHFRDNSLGDPIDGTMFRSVNFQRASRGTDSTRGNVIFIGQSFTPSGLGYGVFTPEHVIAFEGDVIEGLTLVGILTNGNRPAISDSGLAAFYSTYTEDGSAVEKTGLFAGDATGVIPIALSGSETSEGYVFTQVAGAYAPSIDADDCITFTGEVDLGDALVKTGAFRACLSPTGEVDTDGDGVLDSDDLCPDEDASGLDFNVDGCIDDPAETTADLTAEVEVLAADEVLSNAEGNQLLNVLDDAEALIAAGNLNAAEDKLNNFKKKVDRFVRRGELTEEEGASLLAAADAILAVLYL